MAAAPGAGPLSGSEIGRLNGNFAQNGFGLDFQSFSWESLKMPVFIDYFMTELTKNWWNDIDNNVYSFSNGGIIH